MSTLSVKVSPETEALLESARRSPTFPKVPSKSVLLRRLVAAGLALIASGGDLPPDPGVPAHE